MTLRIVAVVCDVAWVNGLAAVRSLGRAGAPVIALDHRRGALGFTRLRPRARCPDPVAEEAALVAAGGALGEELDRPRRLPPTTST